MTCAIVLASLLSYVAGLATRRIGLVGRVIRALPRPRFMVHRQHAPVEMNAPHGVQIEGPVPRIAIVTPSFNQADYIGATIASVIDQGYPNLFCHVQDGASHDGTIDILKDRQISWRSAKDAGQADAINKGFADIDCDIMAYLNSDDLLLPGSLAYVADFFNRHPDVGLVYGHRIFIDHDGMEIGRGILPRHDPKTLRLVDFVPQETMFWRRSVWDRVGPFDPTFKFALDWDFLLRAQDAGVKMERLPRFLGAFRIHGQQKNETMHQAGQDEMYALRCRALGRAPRRHEILLSTAPYMAKQLVCDWWWRQMSKENRIVRTSPACVRTTGIELPSTR